MNCPAHLKEMIHDFRFRAFAWLIGFAVRVCPQPERQQVSKLIIEAGKVRRFIDANLTSDTKAFEVVLKWELKE